MHFVKRNMNLSIISSHRAALMGVATILIIVCHGPANGVVLPPMIERIIRWFGIGVDLFLFLSGLGMYFSLQKKSGLQAWYLHRYLRILIPFFVISIPYYLFRWIVDEDTFLRFLSNITTFSFWTRHEGAWFVAMLLPLYLLTPWIAKYIDKSRIRILPTLLLCFVSIAGSIVPTSNPIAGNIQMCLGHVPSFFCGYWIGEYVYNKKSIDRQILLMCFGGAVLYAALFCLNVQTNWLLMIPFVIIGAILFETFCCGRLYKLFVFMGAISLESYLFNIYLPVVLRKIGCKDFLYTFDSGNYVFYLLVIVLGILLAYIANMFCKRIVSEIEVLQAQYKL